MRAWLVGGVFLLGCGLGHSSSLDDAGTGGDGGGGGGGGGGGNDSGLIAACPTSVPSTGTSCRQPDLTCEYGSDPNQSCNTVAHCASGAWTVEPPSSGRAICPTPTSNGKQCASTYAGFPVGSACAVQGLECGYPEGYCVCTLPFSGPPMVDASNEPRWVCDTPTTGCPSPRPRAGAPCSEPNQYCDYGGCLLPAGVTMRCIGGVWTGGPIACPL